ncbi:MAG: DUF6636 domain-containing protein [Solirubrobacterales bacterium]
MKKFLLATAVLFLIAAPAAEAGNTTRAQVNAWQSPGGNIQCGYDHGSVVCMIFKQNFAKKPSCKNFYTAVGAVKRRGKSDVDITCWSGVPIVSGPPFANLGYGKKIRRLGVTCFSFRGGMKCKNEDGHGFKLMKARAIRF